jgi:predicted phosphodiesterase
MGKSTNCSQCHVRSGIRVSGEPTLVLEYKPMLFEFVQVSDVHIGKSARQLTNLTDTVAQINSINPAFVLFTGDLTDSGSVEQYNGFKTAVSGLTMPYYCVPGDNDIVDGEGDLQRYREQMGDDYYAFDYQGFNFIGLNNNSFLSLDETQRDWFENELGEGKPEIAFAHKPLLAMESSYAPYVDAATLLSLFDAYKVPLYMNGHSHEAASHTRNDTHFIWCDNLSFSHLGDTYNLYRVYADRILLYHVDLRDGSQTFAGSFPLAQPPTLITLASFEAVPSHNKEIDNAGFNIYRAGTDGEYTKINDSIIPAQGTPTNGAQYQFIDNTATNRRTYSYKLEDIDTSGTATLHGPVEATPGLIYLFK